MVEMPADFICSVRGAATSTPSPSDLCLSGATRRTIGTRCFSALAPAEARILKKKKIKSNHLTSGELYQLLFHRF